MPIRIKVSFESKAEDSSNGFVMDRSSPAPGLLAKVLFGANGIYSEDNFFGILDEGSLFFKTDGTSQADDLERGLRPFTCEMKGKTMTLAYHEMPPEVLNQPRTPSKTAGQFRHASD